ncbi:hypothetical protein, partial [Staphylococcus aureus]|uniref:hypothetical protein n=1 Tax=Staphylococcus aureus TaxID=1280 RepID=UPI00301E0BD4
LLWALLEAGASPGLLVLPPALARFGALALLRLAPLARREGLAWTWRRHLARRDLALSLLPLAVAFGFLPVGVWLLATLLVFLLLLFVVFFGLAMVRAFTG